MIRARHAIVIGASSGIGAELVRQLAASGCRVAAVARRLPELEALAREHPNLIFPVEHDVCHVEEVPRLFDDITRRLEGLDLVIYAAGVMPAVGPSEFSLDKDREMILVNDLGAVAWLNLASERFLSTKHGTIVGIGSVAGDRGRMGQPVYNASKAFLHTYLEALRNRLHRHGVRVVTIKPGPTRTPMTAHLRLHGAMMPEEAARRILKVSGSSGEKYLTTMHRIIFAIIRLFPSWIFRRLSV